MVEHLSYMQNVVGSTPTSCTDGVSSVAAG